MIGHEETLIAGMACAAFAAAVALKKSRSPILRLTLLSCLGVFLIGQFAVMRVAGASGPGEAESAARALYLTYALGGTPFALIAVLVQGADGWWRYRGRSAFVGASLVGGVALATLAGSDLVFHAIARSGESVRIELGVAGKLLLVYSTAIAAFVLTQVEVFYRATSRSAERTAKITVFMVALSVIAYVYVAGEAFLYGRLLTTQLVTASIPAAVTCVAVALFRLRNSLDDMQVPAARGVVYSSFTLFVLGLMMILLGLLSRVAELAGVSVSQTFFLATTGLAATLGLSLWISPSLKRRVAVFIDENFYVNRHDYRKQWSRVARNVRPGPELKELVSAALTTVREIFACERVYVAVLRPGQDRFAVFGPDDSVVTGFEPPSDGDLAALLEARGAPVLLADVDDDLDVVPAFVENRESFERLEIAVVVPMRSGGRLVGFYLLTNPRSGGAYTPEDVSLMTVVGAELANTIQGHLLIREVEEQREGETLVQLSSFVLHDLKNCVSSVRGVLDGAEKHLDRPEFRSDLVASLSATSVRMTRLMERLGALERAANGASAPAERIRLEELIGGALDQSAVRSVDGVHVRLEVDPTLHVRGDRDMLERVFVNLYRNALEAMPGGGKLSVVARPNGETVQITVADEGCGIDATFLAESAFRPFATTKSNGMGIGLYQCKNIVEEHEGRIRIDSRRGEGTTVSLTFPTAQESESECETAY